MKTTDFAKFLTTYLTKVLPGQRNFSTHTITSYRDRFKLLLLFCQQSKGIALEQLTLSQLDDTLVYEFVAWIEAERHCSISTRNQRLAAIHAFFRYVQTEAPEQLLICQRILSIPFKKLGNRLFPF